MTSSDDLSSRKHPFEIHKAQWRESSGNASGLPFKDFKLQGKLCRLTLIAPNVSMDGKYFQIDANIHYNLKGAKSCKDLTEPQAIRGWYLPAEFVLDMGGYECTFTLSLNGEVQDQSSQIFISKLSCRGALPQNTLSLPLKRIKIYAMQLCGVFGTAYPPNFKKYFADGKSYFDAGKDGGIDIDRYGYRVKRSTAISMIEPQVARNRTFTDADLHEVARLHKLLTHGSKYKDIADALNIGERTARQWVAECRKSEVGLLEPTGRKRTKPKQRTKGKTK